MALQYPKSGEKFRALLRSIPVGQKMNEKQCHSWALQESCERFLDKRWVMLYAAKEIAYADF